MPLIPITYDETYFTQGGDIGGYDNYNENSYYEENAALLSSRLAEKAASQGTSLTNKRVLVVG